MLTQFTGKVYGTDQHGVFMVVPVADEELIGKTIEEKLMLGAVRWFFHMVSDMAGSSGSAGKGTGIPGPILSLMKQLSALPLFKDAMTDEALFRKMLSKLFNGTLLKTVDEEGKKIYRASICERNWESRMNLLGSRCRCWSTNALSAYAMQPGDCIQCARTGKCMISSHC